MKPDRDEVEDLLDDLTIQMGYSMASREPERFIELASEGPEHFADAVLAAEGLDPSLEGRLRREVHGFVAARFERWAATGPRAASSAPTAVVSIRFLSPSADGRAVLPSLTGGRYRPHLRVGDGEYLGVAFVDGPEQARHDEDTIATIALIHEVDYTALQAGVGFDVLEGPHLVATGRVVGLCGKRGEPAEAAAADDEVT